MKAQIDSIKQAALAAIEAASSTQELSEVRVRYLGKSGEMTALMKGLGALSKEERPEAGKILNIARTEIESALESKFAQAEEREKQARLAAEAVDVTLPGKRPARGTLHPITQVREDIVRVFLGMGFEVAEGPEIESDLYNFQLLNVPKDHPARDMQDTFFVKGGDTSEDLVLRTHTSSVQVRLMEMNQPPFRAIMPGRVYRNEAISARAHCFFHQIEGLYVDENVSFADLKQTLYHFVKELYGEDTKVRFRPSYFPFTEPSAEMDISCTICKGKGCQLCKHSGWVEILGCGMVDPQVLENCGIDSQKYSGFAFGMGIERITNLKYEIRDLRLFSENDVRFLSQFETELI